MNEKQIRKLGRKFLAVALLSLFLTMFLMGLLVNAAILIVNGSMNENLCLYIVENEGEMPALSDEALQRGKYRDLSRESIFSTRYFAVIYRETGDVEDVINSHIAYVDVSRMLELTESARGKWLSRGYAHGYYYHFDQLDDGRSIAVFIDVNNQLDNMRTVMVATLGIALIGVVIMFLLLRPLSRRVMRSEASNSRRQQEFITNAGHELKTPLAVIRANTEVTEMLSGETEWTRSTMQQVDKMDALVKNFVQMAKSGEQEEKGVLAQIDAGAVVAEAAESFRSVAMQNGIDLVCDAPEGISMRADDEKLRQLTGLLVDNAVKYCDPNGTVRVSVQREKKYVRLVVSNDYAAGKDVDTSRFFDRFYREDQAHTGGGEKSGYGIGLSIAEDLCARYNGSIRAAWKDGVITFTCLLRG